MLAKGTHLWTMQTHPEFSCEFARDLYQRRRNVYTSEEYNEAMQSLKDNKLDASEISNWVIRFIAHHKEKEKK